MRADDSQGLRLLALALLVAALVRVPPVLFEIPVSRDAVEYENIAENLRAGRSLKLDIKAYNQVATLVVHYSGYDRPTFFPAMLAAAEFALPPEHASRLLPPLLFLITLTFAFSTIQKVYSASAAFWATLLLGVHPAFYRLSLLPLSEIAALMFIALAIWGFFRAGSPILTGLAVALAFLSRPSAALVGIVIGIAFILRSIRENSFLPLIVYSVSALVGPAVLIALNIAHHAPALLTPQSFLFRVLHFTDMLHYFHQGKVYDSTFALLAEHGGDVARQITKNAFYYATALAGASEGIGYVLVLVPLALIGAAGSARRGFVILLAAIGIIDLAFYTLSWATFDSARFLMIFNFTSIIWITAESATALNGIAETAGSKWRALAPLTLLAPAILWGAPTGYASYISWRESRTGMNFSQYDSLWNTDDARAMETDLRKRLGEGDNSEPKVIASNEPWLTHRMTDGPSALIPYDLLPNEWIPFLTERKAILVLIHRGDWPEANRTNLDQFVLSLTESNWRLAIKHGELELWENPSVASKRENSPSGDQSR